MAHSSRGVSINQTSVSVNLKRPSSDDDINDENLAVKRTPLEDNRPPLTRGESLPATSFPPERQNFKEKHPSVSRAPSFDAAFKSGGGGGGVGNGGIGGLGGLGGNGGSTGGGKLKSNNKQK